jgi:triacylglycerol lipase
MSGFLRSLTRCLGLAALALGLLAGAPVHAQGYTQTKYPIVLVHGLFGFDAIGPVDYFYGVPSALSRYGARVFVAQVSATNSSEVRGEQLLAQVKTVLALTGAQKVNLIGHSHGGPTIRYVAGVRPDLVASVTSVSGVNKGSKVADILRGVAPAGSFTEAVLNATTSAFVSLINLLSGGSGLPQMPTAALDSLTTNGALKFNAKFPQGIPTTSCGIGAEYVNGVRYFSWAGNQSVTNLLDASDGPLGILSLVHGEPNDGLVAACKARLGTHLGNYYQNHLDEVNQLVGLVDWFSVDPVTLYRQQANRLRNLGL